MIKIVKDMDERILGTIGLVTPNSQAIMVDNILVGIIDYKVTTDYIKIMYITVLDEYRRQGIAKRVMEQIINENRGKYLYGDSLPGALEFWRNLGAEFDEKESDEYLTPFHIEC